MWKTQQVVGTPFFPLPPSAHTHKLPAKFVGGGNRPGKRARIPEQKERKGKSVTCQVSQPCLAHLGTVGRVGEMGTLERGQG